MRLYDTLSGDTRMFESGPEVSVYVCGITPYDTTHFGHAFLYVVFDVLMRHLEARGHTVTYTQNVTDIDDDILRKAAELGMDYRELARRETERFQRDLAALNVRPPDHYPRATEEINRMVELIGRLIDDGHAYEREGNVYFRISSYSSYGALSKLDRSEMLEIAAERGGNPDDPLRDDPLDFQLWQQAAPGEPSWPSPWSDGRPGWHIECSAMIAEHLGPTIDIHGGGLDLIFPHHENEIAQSRCAHAGAPLARYWLHNGFLSMAGGDKMSKSLGNVVTVGELLEQGHKGEVLRLALLSAHYRQPLEWSEQLIAQAKATLDGLYRTAGDAVASEVDPAVMEALGDDLNTPLALERLRDLRTLENVATQGGSATAVLRRIGRS